MPRHALEFYQDPGTGQDPVLDWLRALTAFKRRAAGIAMREILEPQGIEICESEFGKALGEGLFEFRLRHSSAEVLQILNRPHRPDDPPVERVLLRVYFHPYGQRRLLLLHGYDKGVDPKPKREQQEIGVARRRLREFRGRPSQR